jgi:hypothetical protein
MTDPWQQRLSTVEKSAARPKKFSAKCAYRSLRLLGMRTVAYFSLAGATSRSGVSTFETRLVGAAAVLLFVLLVLRAWRSHDQRRRKAGSLGLYESEVAHHGPRAGGGSRVDDQPVSANQALTPSFVSSRRRRGWKGTKPDRSSPSPMPSDLWVAHGYAVEKALLPERDGAGGSGSAKGASPTPGQPHRSPPVASALPPLEQPPPP